MKNAKNDPHLSWQMFSFLPAALQLLLSLICLFSLSAEVSNVIEL